MADNGSSSSSDEEIRALEEQLQLAKKKAREAKKDALKRELSKYTSAPTKPAPSPKTDSQPRQSSNVTKSTTTKSTDSKSRDAKSRGAKYKPGANKTKSATSVSVIQAEIDALREEEAQLDSCSKNIEELEKQKNMLLEALERGSTSSASKSPSATKLRIAELMAEKKKLEESLKSGTSLSALSESHRHETMQTNRKKFGIDVAFLIDCTGSMTPYITAAKQQIRQIMAEVPKIDTRARTRCALVGYRDIRDPVRFECADFVEESQVGALESKLSSIVASGGDDIPEDIAGALQKALNLSWESSTRLVVLVADAPCHGQEYHNLGDNYPQGDPFGLCPQKLLRQMANKRIDFYFCKISNCTDIMIERFKSVYETANRPLQVHTLGSDPTKFLPAVVASIRSSVMRSEAFKA